MKMIVETIGSIMLINPHDGVVIPHNRPAVIVNTPWAANQVALGHLQFFPYRLKDAATDADFRDWWKECDGDRDLALASFASKFGVMPEQAVPADEADETGDTKKPGAKKAKA